jgi:hypothetical protein
MHHHEAAAAQVSGAGQGDRQRQRHGDAGIDRVAAIFEHLQPDFGGNGFLHRDHRLLAQTGCTASMREDRRFLRGGGEGRKRNQGGGREGCKRTGHRIASFPDHPAPRGRDGGGHAWQRLTTGHIGLFVKPVIACPAPGLRAVRRRDPFSGRRRTYLKTMNRLYAGGN